MSLRIVHRVDAPCDISRLRAGADAAGRKVSASEISQRINPNTGALEFRAPLTWTGVRSYYHADGSVTRELRRPEQVRSPSHIRGLRLLTATSGHPALPDGTPVYLDARGGPDVRSPDGSALRPAEDYAIGHVGDAIEDGEIDGYYVPVAWCSITSLASQRGIAAGKTQTSLGYTALLDDTPGVWDGPHGPEQYDVEHLLDHEDARVLRAVADGIVPTVEILVDGVLTRVPVLGPNHYAAEIWAGRGEAQSEILDFALPASEMPRRNADAAPARGRFAVFVSDAAPVASDAAVQRAARTARTDVASVGRLPAEVSAALSSAPLSGRYGNRTEPCPSCGATEANASCETCGATPCGEWLGWIVPTPGQVGAGGIAFVAPDGLGLWWSTRDPSGGVIGLPTAFAWRGPAAVSAAGAAAGAMPPEPESPPQVDVVHATGEMLESVGELIEEAVGDASPMMRPRLFSMVRQADESGVSGTGHVLDGVVWRNGKVSAAWDTANAPGSICTYDAFGDFKSIHVDAHPSNDTILAFDDGGGEPAKALADVAGMRDAYLSIPKVADLRIEYGEDGRECRVSIDGAPGVTISPTPDEWGVVLSQARKLAVPADSLSGVPLLTVDRSDAPQEHSARQADPDKFNAYLRFVLPNGASMILGRFGGGPWQVQSVRFPATWSTAKAKSWLKAAGFSSTQFEAAVKDKSDAVDESAVSFVARDERTPYAFDVRGQGAGARSTTMRKIHLPARLADAAGNFAAVIKAAPPVPVKLADAAMLAVDLPEDIDVPSLAAGMQALTDALTKMSADMSAAEQKVGEMGSDLSAAMIENGDLKMQVDALRDDAAVGKAHRLAEVVAVAKKVGLTDADVKDKDADGVRAAAVARKYPGAAKHLDQKPVLDSMWLAIVDAAGKVPVAPAAAPEPRDRPAPRTDAAGDVSPAAAAAPKVALVTHNYG